MIIPIGILVGFQGYIINIYSWGIMSSFFIGKQPFEHCYNVGPPFDSVHLVKITTISLGFMVVTTKGTHIA